MGVVKKLGFLLLGFGLSSMEAQMTLLCMSRMGTYLWAAASKTTRRHVKWVIVFFDIEEEKVLLFLYFV